MKDLVLLLIVLALNRVRCQKPEITENILPDIKRLGTSGRLNCTVINQLNNKVNWISNPEGEARYLSTDDKIEVEDSLNVADMGMRKYEINKMITGKKITYQLVINRLERKDAGTYRCKIHITAEDDHPYKDGQMMVLVPPSIQFAKTSPTITVQEGEGMVLNCDAEGYPTPNITWVRVNGGMLPNGKLRYQNRTMVIDTVEAEDRGIYRCLADNNVRPPAVHDITVLVNFKPIAKAIQSSYGQAEGRMLDMTIECRISGWPEPDLQWFKISKGNEWVAIDEDSRHNILILLNHAHILNAQERWFQMVIRAVTANDFGDYICQGKNIYGTNTDTVNIFATSECQGANCPSEGGDKSGAPVPVTSSLTSSFLTVVSLSILVFG